MPSLERAATAPAAGIAWQRREGALLLSPPSSSSSGLFRSQMLSDLSIGPLHRAPSRSGSTVQTGETLDGAAAAAVAAIAAEKAGIIKPGVPVLTAAMPLPPPR